MKAKIMIITFKGLNLEPSNQFQNSLRDDLNKLLDEKFKSEHGAYKHKIEICFEATPITGNILHIESRCENAFYEHAFINKAFTQLLIYEHLKKLPEEFVIEKIIFSLGNLFEYVNQPEFEQELKNEKKQKKESFFARLRTLVRKQWAEV